MVSEEESITEDELDKELEAEENDTGFTLEEKKERITIINKEIKDLLKERDEIEREIEDLKDDLETNED